MLEPPEAESPAESHGVEAWQPPSFDGRTRQTSAEDLMTHPLASKAAANVARANEYIASVASAACFATPSSLTLPAFLSLPQ